MTNRIVARFGAVAVVSQLFLFMGCGSSNNPSTTTGAGGTTGAAGTTGSTGTAGTTGSTGTAGTTGTTGTAGTTGSTGTAGTTGSTGTGGTTGAGGAAPGQPACGNTVSSAMPIAKSGTCTSADTQLCYKTCGPASVGFKSETCSGNPGIYNEGDCTFPPGDYSSYAIPTSIPPECPTTAPEAGSAQPACTIASNIVCGGYSNAGTPTQTTGYLDSTGAPKVGYCVCAGTTTKHWSCASTTAWPCPAVMSGVTGC
jgi:collagen type VII alpha